jgi:hypothetical protein
MIYAKDFYEEENNKILEGYEKGIERIKEICLKSEICSESNEVNNFFSYIGKFILKLADMERNLDEEYFKSMAESSSPNKQYDYDHRFDNSLYLDEIYTNLNEETLDLS